MRRIAAVVFVAALAVLAISFHAPCILAAEEAHQVGKHAG